MPTSILTNLPRLCDFQPAPISWLWPGRIPLGRVTLLAGAPGVGKSLIALDLAARVTTARAWPDSPSARINGLTDQRINDPPAPSASNPSVASSLRRSVASDIAHQTSLHQTSLAADVLIISPDHPTEILSPRLRIAGADPARIHLLCPPALDLQGAERQVRSQKAEGRSRTRGAAYAGAQRLGTGDVGSEATSGQARPRNPRSPQSPQSSIYGDTPGAGAWADDDDAADPADTADADSAPWPEAPGAAPSVASSLRRSVAVLYDVLHEALTRAPDIRFIIIDPLESVLPVSTAPQAALAFLASLARFARRQDVAIVLVAQRKGLSGGPGSGGGGGGALAVITAAVPIAWTIVKDYQFDPDGNRRLLLSLKNTLAPDNRGLAFWIDNSTTPDHMSACPSQRPGASNSEHQTSHIKHHTSPISAPHLEWEPGPVRCAAECAPSSSFARRARQTQEEEAQALKDDDDDDPSGGASGAASGGGRSVGSAGASPSQPGASGGAGDPTRSGGVPVGHGLRGQLGARTPAAFALAPRHQAASSEMTNDKWKMTNGKSPAPSSLGHPPRLNHQPLTTNHPSLRGPAPLALTRARAFLYRTLSGGGANSGGGSGGPILARDLFAQARASLHICNRTIRRAAASLPITKTRDPSTNLWTWSWSAPVAQASSLCPAPLQSPISDLKSPAPSAPLTNQPVNQLTATEPVHSSTCPPVHSTPASPPSPAVQLTNQPVNQLTATEPDVHLSTGPLVHSTPAPPPAPRVNELTTCRERRRTDQRVNDAVLKLAILLACTPRHRHRSTSVP